MTYASEVLADTPLVFWKFDETSGTTINDSSGNARAGAYNGTPTLAATGLVQDGGTAVTLNGSTQWGQIANAAWMNGLTAVTIEIVVKGTATNGSIVSRAVNTGPYRLVVSSNKPAFILDTSIGTVLTVTGTTSINDNVTHHIVATWDGATAAIYVDGVQESTGAKGGTIATTATALRVGQRNSDSFFAGTVDCFAMYGTALSSTRVGVHAAGVSGAGVTGTLATTLAGATLAASGTETFTGTFAATLAGSTLAASATVANPVTGTLATTLGGATLAATGVESITGTFTTTLAGATLTAAGGETFTGTLTTTLAGAALSATGVESITGTSSVTLAGVTLAASGSVTIAGVSGSLATTLAGVTLAAAGAETITGAFATTLAGAALSAVGVMQPSGTLAVTLAGATLTAAGNSHQPFRDIKVYTIVDQSRVITITDQSRIVTPVDHPRELVITDRSL